MADVPELRQSLMAEVIVRVGLNLQPGQPLLITEPHELQGIHPEAAPLAAVIRAAAGGSKTSVITSDPAGLRALAEADDLRGYELLVSAHILEMKEHLSRGGAFLFLPGSQPQLMSGVPAERLSRFDQIKWRHLGPIIQRLIREASQWTLAPAPSSVWADAAYADLPAAERLPALWRTVLTSLRADKRDPLAAWHTHLAALTRRRDELNAARHRGIRYTGPGTDLTLDLPRSHRWCTAQLTSKAGIPFVANLPTEEIFTAPHKNSASGTVRVSRPVTHGGAVIDGIELEFRSGRVVSATATNGQDALQQLLATDDGARRIGEVALVPGRPGWASVSPFDKLRTPSLSRGTPTPVADRDIGDHPNPRLFHHTLLDENAANHIALGDAYRFCTRALLPLALNTSQVHLDLPLDATVELT